MSLKGRMALITGSSRGLGAAMARELAARGARVVVNYRSGETEARAVCEGIRSAGGWAEPVAADISDEAAVQTMFEGIREEWGDVTILVNNAGILRDGPALMLPRVSWDQVLGVNLTGAFLCAREAMKDMISSRWGRIVSITSPSGLLGRAGQANYSASKAGLIGLTMTLARELARFGITVNAVAPGVVETEMLQGLSPKVLEELVGGIPLGRTGTPEEVARVVAFLVDGSDYITGQVLRVDGGLVMG